MINIESATKRKKAAALMGITPQAAAAIKKRAIASLRTKLLRG